MTTPWPTQVNGQGGTVRSQAIGLVLIMSIVSMSGCGEKAEGTNTDVVGVIVCQIINFSKNATVGEHRQCVRELAGRGASRVARVGGTAARAGESALLAQLRFQNHFAAGNVSASKIPSITLEIPLATLANPEVSRASITVGVNLFDKKYKTPKKQFKSITVEVRVDGKLIGNEKGTFDEELGSASVAFEGLKLAAEDIAVATVKVSGGKVADTTILVTGAAAGE